MFFISHEKKIAIIFIATMTLTLLQIGFFPITRNAIGFLIICFLISEIRYFKEYLCVLKRSFISNLFILLIISTILVIFFSPHLHTLHSIFAFIRDDLFFKYFVLAYAFVAVRNEKNLSTIIRCSIIPMIILTLFGVQNLIEHRSSFVTEMMSNWSKESITGSNFMGGDIYVDADRFRVQAMFINPFSYGYICSLCLLVYLYGFLRKIIKKGEFIILLCCCIFGILFCGCRTIVLCAIFELSVFSVLSLKKNTHLVFFTIVIASIITYITIPKVAEIVDRTTTVFTDTSGDKVKGSNMEMRTVQLAKVFFYIADHEAFGRGFNFFAIDMGGKERSGYRKDNDLVGLEGVYLIYLLERGIVGYMFYLFIWISLFYIFISRLKTFRLLSALGVSVLTLYTLFANMTGEILSVCPTLLVLGSLLGIIAKKEYIDYLFSVIPNKRFKDIVTTHTMGC